MHDTYETKELAHILDVTVRSISRSAKRESWKSVPRSGRGGGNLWLVSSMPESVRLKILAYEEKQAQAQLPPAMVREKKGLAQLSDKQRSKALARADVVALYADWINKSKTGSKTKARERFIEAYKAGAWLNLMDMLGPKISWKSIERWKVQLRKDESAVSLADQRGQHHAGRTILNDEQKDISLRCVLTPNAPTLAAGIRQALALMQAQNIPLPCNRTIERYIKSWVEENFGEWTYTREGKKAWNDKAAFFIERDYSLIEVGDILVADGHVLNFETINPKTGKPKRMELVVWYDMASNCPVGWEVLPTENIESIANAFRRACINLGKYPQIAYLDNGRAFRSKYFNGVDFKQTGIRGLFGELGIKTIFAWPYHGQSKIVERFFGTLHELEQFIPSYVGNCIDNKPPRLNRGEKLHRKTYEATGCRPLTMDETHIAIAKWIDEYINRSQRGHLKGKCPAKVFLAGRGPGIDETKLRHLMMHKKRCKITRRGVKLQGHHYYAPELYSRTHTVDVRYDPQNLSSILVYHQGQLLCEAPEKTGIHPAAMILGNEKHQSDFKKAIELKKSQEKQAASITKGVLENALEDQARRIKQLEAEAAPQIPEQQIKAQPLPQSKIHSIEEAKKKAAKAKAEAPAYTPPAEMRSISNELEKYEYLFQLKYKDSVELRDPDLEWMAEYEASEEYIEVAAPRFQRLKNFYARKSVNRSE